MRSVAPGSYQHRFHRPRGRARPYRPAGAAVVATLIALLLMGGPLVAGQPFAAASAAPAAADDSDRVQAQTSGSYRVFATREGLVGGYTSNGHLITPWDYFVSLPACTTTSCPGASPGRPGMTTCGSLCYVKVINPATGACRTEPVIEVGPWFTVDDWWNPADVRFLNKLPSNRQILPQGLPGAQAAWDGKNVGYGWGPGGIGGSDYYSSVGNPAGIDLADGTYWSLGIGGIVGNWVDVEMLWQTGESPAAAAASCGHQLGRGGGAIPRWTPTPAPTVVLIAWGTATVTGTGGAGLNCRTAPSGSGTVITVLAEGATVTLRGPAANGWFPVICSGQAGYASASYLTTTATPTPTVVTTRTTTPTATTTTTATPTATASPTTTTTLTATVAATATGSTTPTATLTATATTTATLAASATGTAAGSPTGTTLPSPSPTGTATPSLTAAITPPTVPPSPTASIRPSATPTSGPAIWGSGTVANTGGAGVNCRVGPSTATGVIAVLPEGTGVQLTGPASGGWQPVLCGGRPGYISAQYLRSVPFTPTPASGATRTATIPPTVAATSTRTITPTSPTTAPRTPTPTARATGTSAPSATPGLPTWGTGTVRNTGGAGVNCRTAPTTAASIIRALADGTTVQLTGPAAGGWQPVVCAGRQGYIAAQYLGTVQFTPTANASPTAIPTPTGTPPVSGGMAERLTATPTAPEPSPTTPAVVEAPSSAPAAMGEPTAPPEPSPTAPAPPPSVEPAETAAPVPTEEVITTAWVAWTGGQGLACMTAPSWESATIAVLPEGSEVAQIGIPVNGWQAIRCGETRGYVDAASLSPVPVTPEPTAPAAEVGEEATEPPLATEEPAAAPAPQTFTFAPVSETSVLRTSPDLPQGGISGDSLTLGGPEGGTVALSFDLAGFADGTVVQATLVVTGAGETAGAGGPVLAVPGAILDPGSTTIGTIDGLGGAAIGWLDAVAPGVPSSVDVTGIVANGALTIVLTGSETAVSLAGTGSGAGPILIVTAATDG